MNDNFDWDGEGAEGDRDETISGTVLQASRTRDAATLKSSKTSF